MYVRTKILTADRRNVLLIAHKFGEEETAFVLTTAGGCELGKDYRMAYICDDRLRSHEVKPVDRPATLVRYYEAAGAIDNINRYRQHDMRLQDCWPTTNYWFHEFVDSEQLAFVDMFMCMKANKAGVRSFSRESGGGRSESIVEFLDRVMEQMMPKPSVANTAKRLYTAVVTQPWLVSQTTVHPEMFNDLHGAGDRHGVHLEHFGVHPHSEGERPGKRRRTVPPPPPPPPPPHQGDQSGASTFQSTEIQLAEQQRGTCAVCKASHTVVGKNIPATRTWCAHCMGWVHGPEVLGQYSLYWAKHLAHNVDGLANSGDAVTVPGLNLTPASRSYNTRTSLG